MQNLRISGKLLACFSLLLIALMGLAALTVVRLGEMRDVAVNLGGEQRAQLEAIAVINASTATYRATVGQHLLSVTPEDRAVAAAADRRASRPDRGADALASAPAGE